MAQLQRLRVEQANVAVVLRSFCGRSAVVLRALVEFCCGVESGEMWRFSRRNIGIIYPHPRCVSIYLLLWSSSIVLLNPPITLLRATMPYSGSAARLLTQWRRPVHESEFPTVSCYFSCSCSCTMQFIPRCKCFSLCIQSLLRLRPSWKLNLVHGRFSTTQHLQSHGQTS